MFKLNRKFDADLSRYLLSQFECDAYTIQVFTQWRLPPPMTSTVKLSLFTLCIPIHCPWLPGYIDVGQTILVILTMAGLFPYRPCVLWVQTLYPFELITCCCIFIPRNSSHHFSIRIKNVLPWLGKTYKQSAYKIWFWEFMFECATHDNNKGTQIQYMQLFWNWISFLDPCIFQIWGILKPRRKSAWLHISRFSLSEHK